MDLWKQIPWTTKVALVVMVLLSALLIGLSASHGLPRARDRISTWIEAKPSITSTSEGKAKTPTDVVSITSKGPRVIAIYNATIYSGPGDGYGAVAVLMAGGVAEVTGISQDKQWWAIKVPYIEGGVGWVSADRVSAEDVDNVKVVDGSNPTTQSDVPTVIAIANVVIRRGPGLQYERVGLLKKGETAEVVGVDSEGFWWAIKVPSVEGGIGWISEDYVVAEDTDNVPVLTPIPLASTKLIPTPAPGSPSLTALTVVNIRSGPGREYAIIGRLEAMERAEVIGISSDGQWLAIKFPSAVNGRGWVSIQYVKAENIEGVPVLK